MKATIQKYTATFNYKGRPMPLQYWTHSRPQTPIDTVIFLGSGQIGRIPKWVAAASPVGVVVVAGLPHWKADPSAHDLKEFTDEYTFAAFNAVLKKFRLKRVNVIAISQAVPGATLLAIKMSEKVRNVGLVTPLGLTVNAFGTSAEARIKELKKRALRTTLQLRQSPFYSPRNLYVLLVLLRARLSETKRGASDKKYAAGLSYNLIDDCRVLLKEQQRKNARFITFLGEKDVVFPVSEVSAALNNSGLHDIEVIVMPKMSHASFVSRHDKVSLRQIVVAVRS
jgi:pimeloyl-ACP methyl ester carboxylesterase